jgi:hypothetical protein
MMIDQGPVVVFDGSLMMPLGLIDISFEARTQRCPVLEFGVYFLKCFQTGQEESILRYILEPIEEVA